MIVTTVMGGLGNQLFQYAAGRTASLRTDRPLWLDVTRMPSPAGGALRRLGLPGLPIPRDTRVLRRPGRRSASTPPSQTVLRIDHRLRGALRRWTIAEPETHDVLVDLSEPPRPMTLLFGYWQSHRYHVGAEQVLRRELTPPVASDGRIAGLLRRLEGHQAVSVHVRRGDYVTDSRVARELGAQTIGYYRRGLELVASRCDRPAFVVLSDDPAWAAENVRLDAPIHHVELDQPLEPIEALALMSRAQHAVIANSSLSWWGARLAVHDAQTVVAPARWFSGRESDPDHRLPPEWIRLG